MASALIIVDVQNDFCPPSGALRVEGGHEVIPVINALRAYFPFDVVVLTQDYHPLNHVSFYSTHQNDPQAALFEPYTLPGTGEVQVMWPDHCVQQTPGAEFHPRLNRAPNDIVVQKGVNVNVDSYSGFYDNNKESQTELCDVLRRRNVQDVYVCGLAYDYCVGNTALDAASLGFNTIVIDDATRGVAQPTTEAMKERLRRAGVSLIQSAQLRATRRQQSMDEQQQQQAAATTTAQEQLQQRRKRSVSERTKESVEAYFAQHGIADLFLQLTLTLAEQRPDDPLAFIQQELHARQQQQGQ